jgi:hypothetical protein
MEKTLDEMRETFTKVITAKVLITIKNHYGTLEAFKAATASKSNTELARYNKNFHVDGKILHKLTRHNGKRVLAQILSSLDNTRLVYKAKYDKVYKSGKRFSKPSTFYIPFPELERLFALDGTDKTPFRTDSSFYTDEEHRLLDRLIFGYGAKERKEYTKSERFKASVERRKKAHKAALSKGNEELTDEDVQRLLSGLDFND